MIAWRFQRGSCAGADPGTGWIVASAELRNRGRGRGPESAPLEGADQRDPYQPDRASSTPSGGTPGRRRSSICSGSSSGSRASGWRPVWSATEERTRRNCSTCNCSTGPATGSPPRSSRPRPDRHREGRPESLQSGRNHRRRRFLHVEDAPPQDRSTPLPCQLGGSDSSWEGEFCRVVEGHPQVLAYVKNHNLGFTVPIGRGWRTAPTCRTSSWRWTTGGGRTTR